jgi:RNA polymerase sigma factor (sigma-70 family)
LSDSRRLGDNKGEMSASDHDLLRAYAREGSQTAFAEIVHRHLDLVYSAARRQVRSPELADEIAQSVFTDLARNGLRITSTQPLAAWLHVVTRRTAIDVIRREARRSAREQHAAQLASVEPRVEPAMKDPAPVWETIEPLLDEAVDSLNATDRAAILMRFFQNKSLRDVGATLGASEDAAQKRVARAIDQLRTFFRHRGIAVTAAGLATDLSAHALRTAPTGLGAIITATSAKLAPAIALHSTATTLAMTTLQKFGIAAAFVTAAATAYQATVIYRQHCSLETARVQTAALATEIKGLRATRKANADRLQQAQQQLNSRPVTRAAAPTNPALESQMKTWLAQLDQLRRFVAANPKLDIPELQFLSEEDWFTIAAGGAITSEEDFRRASAGLRTRAEGIFAGKISRALSAFVRANNDRLPETPQQLAAYFDPPIDPTLLDRYEMLQRGKASDVPSRERMKMIAAIPVDVEYDVFQWAGIDGYGNNGGTMGYNLAVAQRAFRRAHPDQEPTDATLLLPYLKWPVDPAVLQKYIDRDRNRKGDEP